MFINNKVTQHKTGVTKINDDTFLSTSNFFKNRLSRKADEVVKESMDRMVELEEKESKERAKVERHINRNTFFKRIEEAHIACKEYIFKDMIFDIFMESLYLDESFKSEYSENIKRMSDMFIEDNGGANILIEALKREPMNPILNSMGKLLFETSKKVNEKNKSSNKDGSMNIEVIDFKPEDDILEEYETSKKNIDVDYISEKVKDKVKDVIKNEQEVSEEKIKTLEDLEKEEKVEETTKIREELLRVKYGIIKENTDSLFVSIMKKVYKDALLESTGPSRKNDGIEEDPEENGGFENDTRDKYDMDVGLTEEELNDMESEEQLEKEHDLDYNDNSHEVNIDQVMTEAIAIYTLYETFNTTKLIPMGPRYVKDLIKKLSK